MHHQPQWNWSILYKLWGPRLRWLSWGSHNFKFTMNHGTYIELVTGVYKPTYNWWAYFDNYMVDMDWNGTYKELVTGVYKPTDITFGGPLGTSFSCHQVVAEKPAPPSASVWGKAEESGDAVRGVTNLSPWLNVNPWFINLRLISGRYHFSGQVLLFGGITTTNLSMANTC